MGGDYEGLRLLKRVKSLWLTPSGDGQVNKLLAEGWTIMKVEVYHGEDGVSVVWILGHKKEGVNDDL